MILNQSYQTSLYRKFDGFVQAKFTFCGWFRLQLIFTTFPAASKNNAQCKSGQNRFKTYQLALLI